MFLNVSSKKSLEDFLRMSFETYQENNITPVFNEAELEN
jgi:hypothetical protein